MKIEESVIIHHRPEEVFGYLEVRSNDSAWMASVVESEWLNPTAGIRPHRSASVAAGGWS
jgi:hypothetical protein